MECPIKSNKQTPTYQTSWQQQRNLQNKHAIEHDRAIEAPHTHREIPQCMRCQKFGHTKNYCRNNPRCVKCAAEHLTNNCPRKVRDDNVKCVNCNEKHPSNYRVGMVHKQIQQKLCPRLRKLNIAIRPIQSGVIYTVWPITFGINFFK